MKRIYTIKQNGLSYRCRLDEYGVTIRVPGGYMYAKDMEQSREYVAKCFGNLYGPDQKI